MEMSRDGTLTLPLLFLYYLFLIFFLFDFTLCMIQLSIHDITASGNEAKFSIGVTFEFYQSKKLSWK